MPSSLDKVREKSESEVVKEVLDFDKTINKWLFFGHTRHQLRFGSVGHGHEHFTDSQVYAQTHRELWAYCSAQRQELVSAMRAEADLMDAKEKIAEAKKDSDKLRAQADVIDAETRLANAEAQVVDRERQIDELNKIRLELKDKVEKQFPEGLEQAEPSNWETVMHVRMHSSPIPGRNAEHTKNIPLDPERKAILGQQYSRPDMVAPFVVTKAGVGFKPKKEVKHEAQKSDRTLLGDAKR